MNKRILTVFMLILCIGAISDNSFAQDESKKNDGSIGSTMKAEMHKSSHHKMVLAFRKNIQNLAKVLSEMARDEKNFDKEIAGIAIEEMEHYLEKIDEIHTRHLATLSKEMRKKIEAKRDKKDDTETSLNEHICELSMNLQSDSLNLKVFAEHADAIILYFQKKE